MYPAKVDFRHWFRYVDYNGRGVIHEAFWHKTSATNANVTKFGTVGVYEGSRIYNMRDLPWTKSAKSRYIGISS